ncbi:MAG: FliM/FliN family flagellar motor switch protein [Deltaproteobacteria bacterium]|jgi:flagellar motor switch protein FliN/FliY|nr:FliM/FliN family flagellar motor switch protein [Deltaproteobacteria bacterium]
MSIASGLFSLSQDSDIDLSKLAGKPVEMYVNDKLVARGEVEVVNGEYFFRVIDIVGYIERVIKLA